MPVSDAYLEWLLAQLDELGPVDARRMFGGYGLYSAGTFFGVVDDDTTFFRADDATRPAYEARGMGPFQPIPTATPMKRYWQVPDDVLSDPTDLATWARGALEAARRDPAPARRRTAK